MSAPNYSTSRDFPIFAIIKQSRCLSAQVDLVAGEAHYFEILLKEDMFYEHVTLWWTRPGAEEPEIIGAEHIVSYQQPIDDRDRDGMADAVEEAAGLNPDDGTGGGYHDTDGDGFSDYEELYLMETDPTVSIWREGVSGAWQVERWYLIEGATTASLKTHPRFGGPADETFLITSSEYAPEELDAGEQYGLRIRGLLRAPLSGVYTFQLTGDADAQLWFSATESPYDRRRLLELDKWTEFRELDRAYLPSVEVVLSADQSYYVEILLKEDIDWDHLSLWWTPPGAAAPQLISAEYMHSYVQPLDDVDKDGLPDGWEQANGLDTIDGIGGGYRDYDGDGYCDFAEYTLGFDPRVADADADRLSDGDERIITQTDPLRADSDGDGLPDLRTVLHMPGADYVDYHDAHISATWSRQKGAAVVTKPFARPWVLYSFRVEEAGIYRMAVDAHYSRAYELWMEVEIDGIPLEEMQAKTAEGLPTYTFFTPWLSVGEHTLKLTPVHFIGRRLRWRSVRWHSKRSMELMPMATDWPTGWSVF